MEVYSAQFKVTERDAKPVPMATFINALAFILLVGTVILSVLATGVLGDLGLFLEPGLLNPGLLLLDPWLQPSVVIVIFPILMALYQFVWVIYTMTLLKVKVNFCLAPCLHIHVFIPYNVALLLIMAWLFTAGRGRADIALGLDFAITIALCITTLYAIRSVEIHGVDLQNAGMYHHVRLIRGLVVNGVAMAAAVFTMSTVMSLGNVLQHYEGAPKDTAETLVLGIIGAVFLVWIALDWFILETYLRYLFSPYIVVLAYLAGIAVTIYDPWDLNTILSFTLIGFVALCTIVKFILSGVRINKYIDPVLVNNNTMPSMSGSRESNISRIQIGPSRTSQIYSSSDSLVPHRAASTSLMGSTHSLPGSALPVRLHSTSLLGSTHSAPMPVVPHGAPSTGGFMTYDRPGSLFGDVTSPRYVVDAGNVTTARTSGMAYSHGSLYQ